MCKTGLVKLTNAIKDFIENEEKVPFEVNRYCARKLNLLLELAETYREEDDNIDPGEISDGYHTFNELYLYRMLYNAAFFNLLPIDIVHKSKRHNDGEECFGGGWFIVMAELPTGQISNHYELKYWDLFNVPEKEVADQWDGHTPQEAAERLQKYLESGNTGLSLLFEISENNKEESKYKKVVDNIVNMLRESDLYEDTNAVKTLKSIEENIKAYTGSSKSL